MLALFDGNIIIEFCKFKFSNIYIALFRYVVVLLFSQKSIVIENYSLFSNPSPIASRINSSISYYVYNPNLIAISLGLLPCYFKF